MTVEELALALGQARHINNGQWEATCPAHDDAHASLHITTGNKRPIVFTCRSGCPNPDIVTALKTRGLWGKVTASAGAPAAVAHTPPAEKEDDWTVITPVPENAREPFETSNKRWAYRDAESRLLGYVERVDGEHGKQIYPLTYCRSKTVVEAQASAEAASAVRPRAAREEPEPAGLDRLPG